MKQQIVLPASFSERFTESLKKSKWNKFFSRKINSCFKIKRKNAALYLGVLGTETARIALEKAIVREKDPSVKLYMANALADIGDRRSIPVLVATLSHSHRWYKSKVTALLVGFEADLNDYLLTVLDKKEIELQELIVEFSAAYPSKELQNYLINIVDNQKETLQRLSELSDGKRVSACSNCVYGNNSADGKNIECKFKGNVSNKYVCHKYVVLPASIQSYANFKSLVYRAMEILAGLYFADIDREKYLNSEDVEIRNITIRSLATKNSMQNVKQIVEFLRHEETRKAAVYSMTNILGNSPRYIGIIATLFFNETDRAMKACFAQILAGRIEYFIMKLSTGERKKAAAIIREILLLEKSSEVIGFLNKNKEPNIENEMIAIISEAVVLEPRLRKEFCTYLNERLLAKCGFERTTEENEKKEGTKDRNLTKQLYLLLFVAIVIFPGIYFSGHYNTFADSNLMEHAKQYVTSSTYYLAFYSAAVNLSYLLLLGFSFLGASQQFKLWSIKTESMLFKKNFLPTVSIIAPAYNEAKTIIESANSLLNLKYPDYELIIVNDGSKDKTLEVLIDYFELVRIDYLYEKQLKTMPVRGIYICKAIPELIVVDKENGGKADSLNAGINISTKEYFCGIDADSLLEEDALLRLASMTLDQVHETPALGGNILPINGCTIDHGLITAAEIPKNRLARFQTIEYLRAFMAGRLGWSYINSLLIISGAFGLFRKERIIKVGGYLTSAERYAKDTVGEDMELVVRVCRLMRELGLKYKVCYAFHSNCWTEVPEDIKSLKKQRYRWHRGLIDILSFHKKIMFNGRYGRMGLLAFPYFLIFEVFGPLIEIQGYIMVLVAFAFGLLNNIVIAALLIAIILLGILVSLSSIWLAERELNILSYKSTFLLILYSVLENFGPRQLFSLWRVGGYFKMFQKSTGWGEMKRKGF
ncbi:MAG: glycosyltransferase [Syntrophomonadaceae bacterium]|nr:glycosyltransferase [Syntrophomonadaceae bacterium]